MWPNWWKATVRSKWQSRPGYPPKTVEWNPLAGTCRFQIIIKKTSTLRNPYFSGGLPDLQIAPKWVTLSHSNVRCLKRSKGIWHEDNSMSLWFPSRWEAPLHVTISCPPSSNSVLAALWAVALRKVKVQGPRVCPALRLPRAGTGLCTVMDWLVWNSSAMAPGRLLSPEKH